MTQHDSDTSALGILVGGGPAPGINAVIAAATIRARLSGARVLGIRNGFEELMKPGGDPARARGARGDPPWSRSAHADPAGPIA